MKLGLALSGGGIKGAAHIGVLKAFEDENIKIDYISGTSSGSIVATLYAIGYKPEEIQTDNGEEFTYNRSDIKKKHPLEEKLKELGIKHHKIRPRTPEHNGKVERSHRNDNERFYSWLTFYSLEDLRKQGAAYLKRSNRIPMAVLGYLTPKEKRAQLMCA